MQGQARLPQAWRHFRPARAPQSTFRDRRTPIPSHHRTIESIDASLNPSMTTTVLIAFCTCPNEEVAARIAETLVAERLAACVNQVPGVRSTYLWQGEIVHDGETLLLIKTTDARFEALAARLRELHPYELPEIVATPVSRGLAEYLKWVSTCTE
jgi:periplasmic divalent cation tolerance protein